MSGPLDAWRSEPVLESGGVWVDVPDAEGVRFKLRRFGGTNLGVASRYLEMRSEWEARGDLKTDVDKQQFTASFISSELVCGWEGMGVDFSSGEAYRTLIDKPDLCAWIQERCHERATFRNDDRPERFAVVPDVGERADGGEDGDSGSPAAGSDIAV